MLGDIATFYISPAPCLSKHPTDHGARAQLWSGVVAPSTLPRHLGFCLACTSLHSRFCPLGFNADSRSFWQPLGPGRAPLSFPIAGPLHPPLAGSYGSGSTWLRCAWRCSCSEILQASGILVLFQLRPRLSSAPVLTKLLAYQCSLSAVAHT